MIKTHSLKIREEYADAVLSGDKTFEVRYNDRGYQKGDEIVFNVLTDYGYDEHHELSKKRYQITYVLSHFGLQDNYVVLAIKECKSRIKNRKDGE